MSRTQIYGYYQLSKLAITSVMQVECEVTKQRVTAAWSSLSQDHALFILRFMQGWRGDRFITFKQNPCTGVGLR